MIYLLLVYLLVFVHQVRAQANAEKYLTMCKAGENYLVREAAASSFLEMPNTRIGPCRIISPNKMEKEACFSPAKDVCSDRACVGLSVPCYGGPIHTLGVGECTHGFQTCVRRGKLSACTGAVHPQRELCNGRDDDCDGVVDNGFNVGGVCEVTHGTCTTRGKLMCSEDGLHTTCTAKPKFPEKEVCWDGVDNDCNDLVDCFDPVCQGATRDCYTGRAGTLGVGVCSAGKTKCLGGGKLSECAGQTLPSFEICDGVDNDCDGQVDEPPLIGIVEGEEECVHGKLHGCFPSVHEATYLNIMASIMEKFPDDYEKMRKRADQNTDNGRDSMAHEVEMFVWLISKWIASNSPADDIALVSKFEMTFTNGELVSVKDFTPDRCQMWPPVGVIVDNLAAADAALQATTMQELFMHTQVHVEILNPRCLHEMCPDGTTLMTCTDEGVFGGNCSQ